MFDDWVQHGINNWTQSDLKFLKMRNQKYLRSMKKRLIGSNIREKIDIKCLETVK